MNEQPADPDYEAALQRLLKLYGDPDDPTKLAAKSLNRRIRAELDWLTVMAHRGDRDAFDCLVDLATNAASSVQLIATTQQKVARNSAMKRMAWPALISDSANFPIDLDTLRKRLRIGGDLPVAFRKPPDFASRTGCREIVYYCISILQSAKPWSTTKRKLVQQVRLARRLREQIRATPPDLARELRIAEHVATIEANGANKEFKRLEKQILDCLDKLTALLKIRKPMKDTRRLVGKELESAIDLPRFAVRSSKKWANAVVELLKAKTGGELERSSSLRRIGRSKEGTYFSRKLPPGDAVAARQAAKGNKKLRATRASEIQGGIITKIREMTKRLLRKK